MNIASKSAYLGPQIHCRQLQFTTLTEARMNTEPPDTQTPLSHPYLFFHPTQPT